MFEPISQLTKRQKVLHLFFFFTLLSDLVIRYFHFRSSIIELIIETAFVICILGYLFEMAILIKQEKKSRL
ncbi:hypothetical protein [Peribacillus butanolivorans]